jgi:hypothetical protein
MDGNLVEKFKEGCLHGVKTSSNGVALG